MHGEKGKNSMSIKSPLSVIKNQSRTIFKENAKSIVGVTLLFCVTILIIQYFSNFCSRHIINSVINTSFLDLFYTLEKILSSIFVMILSLPLQIGYFSCCINKSFSIKGLFSFYSIKKIKPLLIMFIFSALPFSVVYGILINNLVIWWRCNLFTLLFAILTFILGTVLLISIFLYLHSPFKKYINIIKQSYKIFLRSFTDIIKFNLSFIPCAVILLIMIRFSYHLYIINAKIYLLSFSRLLIFPTMYGFGLVIIPYYLLSLVNMLEKIKTGRRLNKGNDKKTKRKK